MRRTPWRYRLRARVLAAFAVGGLVSAVGIGVLTYTLARGYLVDQRQRSAVRQTTANARLVRAVLRSSDTDVSGFLASLDTQTGSHPLLFHGGEWYSSNLSTNRRVVRPSLLDLVTRTRTSGRQRVASPSGTVLVVGIPIGEDSYFEVFPLVELNRTLRALGWSLVASGGIMFAGSVAIGAWGSGRVVRPIREIGRTAAVIASGQLEARLEVGGDAEMFALASGFNSMVDALQQRIERDARFAGNVSHELRSPLTTLRSAVEVMAAREHNLDGRSRRALALLREEVNRFDALVGSLLEISRFDAGVEHLDRQILDLHCEVERVLRLESLDLPVEGPTAPVAVDPARFEAALRNLVQNARHHAGGATAIRTELAGEGTVARVVVEDEGPGVPAEETERIFERFARGAVSGRRSSHSGVGLGLALVREHIRLQDGSAWVEPRPGGGSRFVLELPIATR